MTKERKAAIKQWEQIRERIKQTGVFKKPDTGYRWLYECWFCQYMRNYWDYNSSVNGCNKCPLWKWAIMHNSSITLYDCGCSGYYNTLYAIVQDENATRKERIKACDLIIAALKGEHIWKK